MFPILRARRFRVCVCMHFSPFLAGPCLEWKWGQKATDLRRHRFAGARDTMVNAEEENGNREKEEEKRKVQERRRERKKREAIRDITKKKKKQTQKHELTLREMQKKNVNTSFGLMRRHSIQKPL